MIARRQHCRPDAWPGCGRPRALTLLEVIIAVALISLLMASMLTFFLQTGQIRQRAAQASDRTALARQVLSHIQAEIRGCVGMDTIGFPVEQRLIGKRRSMTFLTTALPSKQQYAYFNPLDTPPPGQHDLTLVSYQLWIDPENTTENGDPLVGGIIRTEKKTLNQYVVKEDDPLNVRNDLWSPELGYLEFRYFDGIDWDTTWSVTDGNALPQLIQVTVGFKPITKSEYDDSDLKTYPVAEFPFGDDQPHDDRYSTIIRIPAADKLFGSRVQRLGQQVTEQMGLGGAGGLK